METKASGEGVVGKVQTPLQIDKTLTKPNKCADAKVVGDLITQQQNKNKTTAIGSAATGTAVSLPSKFDELIVVVTSNNYGTSAVFTIPNYAINYDHKIFYSGANVSDSDGVVAKLSIDKVNGTYQVRTSSFIANGDENQGTMDVYCKGVVE